MKYIDYTWAIILDDSPREPIFLDYSCARTKKGCIEGFLDGRFDSWKEAKRVGYSCARVKVEWSYK